MGKPVVAKPYVFRLNSVANNEDKGEFKEIVFGNEDWDQFHHILTNGLFAEDYSACKWFLRINPGEKENIASFRVQLEGQTKAAALHELENRVTALIAQAKTEAQRQAAA